MTANIVRVDPFLATSGSTAVSTSALLILDTSHDDFERVKTYTSTDYTDSVDAGTPLRAILDSAFTPSPVNTFVVVGRAKGTAVLTPTGVADTVQYDVTVTVEDGVLIAATYTAGAAETEEDVCVGLKADIDSNTDVTDHVTATVVGVGAAAVLEISLVTGDDDYTLSALTPNIDVTYITTEAASDTLSEVNDYYSGGFGFVVSTDHTDSYRVSLAAACEVAKKIYVVSTQEAESYTSEYDGVTAPASSDIGAIIRFNRYDYSHAMFYDTANTTFPEAARVTEFNWIKPGRTNWQHKGLGFGVAQNTTEGRPLSSSEIMNLESRKMSTILSEKGNVMVSSWEGQGNRVGSGNRIEHVNFGQFAKEGLEVVLSNFLFRVQKEGMNDEGFARISSLFTGWLQPYVGSQEALNPEQPYTIIPPKAEDLSFEDQVAGIAKFEVILYMNASVDAIHVELPITFAEL